MGDLSLAPRMDLDTRCAACSKYRYHDDWHGVVMGGRWYCCAVCASRTLQGLAADKRR